MLAIFFGAMCSFGNARCFSAVVVFFWGFVAGRTTESVCGECYRCDCCEARAGERRTFEDAAKATLRCIMRCYGYERFDNPSAQLSWLQTYADVKTQRDFMNVAWNLLEHILVFPARRGEYWEMHHRPDRVKATRCGVDGLRSDVLKLQKEIRAWQEEFDQRSMPTIDQHAALRSLVSHHGLMMLIADH